MCKGIFTAVVLTAVVLAGCGQATLIANSGEGPESVGLQRLEGQRNDALFAAADKYELPAEALAALAYQRTRLETGLLAAPEAQPSADEVAAAGPLPEVVP